MQLLLPVRHLRLQHRALQPAALPDSKVGVLQRQLRQRRRLTAPASFIENAQLLQKDYHRTAIGRNAVHHQEQQLLRFRQPHQRGTQHQVLRQVERPPDFFGQPLLGRGEAFVRRLLAQVEHCQLHRPGRGDNLHRAAVYARKGGPQDCVAGDHAIEGDLQGRDIEHALQPEPQRNIMVAHAVRPQLLQKPPLLMKGQRISGFVWRDTDSFTTRSLPLAQPIR